MNLYKPIKFDYSRTYCNGKYGLTKLYTKCQKEIEYGIETTTNMTCVYNIANSPMTFRDSMDFEIENMNKECGKTWRNPMQVICFSPSSRFSRHDEN